MEELTKYRILKELGSQKKRKFGNVYLVEYKETGQKAVLKHVYKHTAKEIILERLRSEASFDFDAKGLPKTYYFQENDTEIVLIKEYFEGIPLDLYWNQVNRKERLAVLKSIFIQLAPLFIHLDVAAIAHCDLKPSNIIVNKTENELSVAIIDFGMAVRYPNTEKRKILFPLGYAAPELLLNELDLIDQRADIYSLGIIIWRLFENKLPLMHPNPSVFTNLQLNYPTPEGDSIPKSLMKLIAEMTSKYAFERPPNQLDPSERSEKLKIGINNRPSNFSEVLEKLTALKEKKWIFF
jgi:serine/threonine protein kinase